MKEKVNNMVKFDKVCAPFVCILAFALLSLGDIGDCTQGALVRFGAVSLARSGFSAKYTGIGCGCVCRQSGCPACKPAR